MHVSPGAIVNTPMTRLTKAGQQLQGAHPACTKPRVPFPEPLKHCVVAQACHPHAGEVEVRGSGVQGHPLLLRGISDLTVQRRKLWLLICPPQPPDICKTAIKKRILELERYLSG